MHKKLFGHNTSWTRTVSSLYRTPRIDLRTMYSFLGFSVTDNREEQEKWIETLEGFNYKERLKEPNVYNLGNNGSRDMLPIYTNLEAQTSGRKNCCN